MSQQNPTVEEANAYAAEWIISGAMNKAFRVAFPNSMCSDESAHSKASKLHKHVKIQSSIEQLTTASRKATEKEFCVSVSTLKEMLIDAAKKGLETRKFQEADGNIAEGDPVSISGTVSAIAELNKMDGNHAATRLKLGGDEENPLTLLVRQISGETLGPTNE